jgi:predicted O-methyltransferase YrrM
MLSRMLDAYRPTPPTAWTAIDHDTKERGFTMASDIPTGALLRTLAATKPGGALLELGTGTGLATAWLLDGMDERSRLLSMDNDDGLVSVARRHLGHDPRLTLVVQDGAAFLASLVSAGKTFDLVFADTWPGKYTNLDETLGLVKVGGLYIVDDMLPQPNWPEEHPPKVAALVQALGTHPDFQVTALHWSTGLMIATRVGRKTLA